LTAVAAPIPLGPGMGPGSFVRPGPLGGQRVSDDEDLVYLKLHRLE